MISALDMHLWHLLMKAGESFCVLIFTYVVCCCFLVALSQQTLVLRSCLISQIEGLEEVHLLEKLELYDNHIEVIQNISHLHNLKVLDLSFNAIREMVPLAHCCPLLEQLYVAQNKLRCIEGLEGLVHLKTLDLGANRIRVRNFSLMYCKNQSDVVVLHIFLFLAFFTSLLFSA